MFTKSSWNTELDECEVRGRREGSVVGVAEHLIHRDGLGSHEPQVVTSQHHCVNCSSEIERIDPTSLVSLSKIKLNHPVFSELTQCQIQVAYSNN